MSSFNNDDLLDGGSPLSELDGSSPPQTPGLAQTPGRVDSPVDTLPPDEPSPSRRPARNEAGNAPAPVSKEAPRRSRRPSSKDESKVQEPPAKSVSKRSAKGWAYVTQEEIDRQKAEKIAAEQAEYDDVGRYGRRVRRRSSIVPQQAAQKSQSPQEEAEPTQKADAVASAKVSGPSKIKLTVKKGRKAPISDESASVDQGATKSLDPVEKDVREAKLPQVKPRRALVSDDEEEDDGPVPASQRRQNDKKRPADAAGQKSTTPSKSKKRRRADDDDASLSLDDTLSDEDDIFSDAASESDEGVSKNGRKVVKSNTGKGSVRSRDSDLTRGTTTKESQAKPSIGIAAKSSPLPTSYAPRSPAIGAPTLTKTTPSAAQPQPRPAVRKVQKPSLLNKLMGGPASGSSTPARNGVPRPRPSNAGHKAPGEQGGGSPAGKSVPGSSNGTNASGLSSSLRPGVNSDQNLAMEMHNLRQRERYEHEHPKGLFDLLEDAEIMMEFEEETRQELRYDPFLHKHKLYKPGRTEGIWKLVEHVKKRHAATTRAHDQDQAEMV